MYLPPCTQIHLLTDETETKEPPKYPGIQKIDWPDGKDHHRSTFSSIHSVISHSAQNDRCGHLPQGLSLTQEFLNDYL
jgi:hypothetical protein